MVLSMERWTNKIAVVTGASAGIGAAIAQRFVEEGLIVVGIARRSHRIQDLSNKLADKKGKLYALEADITKEEDILEAFTWISANLGPVSILINNAGVIKQTTLLDGNTTLWKATFDTNVMGLCIATREAAAIMKSNNIDGHIIHINSTAGHIVSPLPEINVYSASKYAVTALTETLRQELNRASSKIRVSSISPGGVRTEILQTNNFQGSNSIAEYVKTMPALEPQDVAEAVMYVLSTPPHVQVHEIIIKPLAEPA